MKIAYLMPSGTIGGAEMCLLDLLATLPTSAPGATAVVLLGHDGPLRGAVEALGVRAEVVGMPAMVASLGDSATRGPLGKLRLLARLGIAAPAALGYAARLRRWLDREKPDLVQSDGMKTHLLSARAVPAGTPVVWHLHDYLSNRPAMASLLRRAGRPRLLGVAVSRSVAADVGATLGPSFRVRAIHNAVDVDRFRPGPGRGEDLDRAAGMEPAPEGTVRVGLVATFAHWKGHDLFLEAVARIPRDRPARFYVVGGPLYRSKGSQLTIETLRDRVEALGLTGRVALTGYRADPPEALRALDVVVHASTSPEPFGRVIAEGMACGRAVVAMGEGGAAEIVRDGVDALVAPPRDPEALARALTRLIDDPGLRRSLGEAGRRSVELHFDRDRLAHSWSEVYAMNWFPDRVAPGA